MKRYDETKTGMLNKDEVGLRVGRPAYSPAGLSKFKKTGARFGLSECLSFRSESALAASISYLALDGQFVLHGSFFRG